MSKMDFNETSERELYNIIIRAQSVLLDKRIIHKVTLENQGKFDIEYVAVMNEVNSLKKGLNALKLFSENIQ